MYLFSHCWTEFKEEELLSHLLALWDFSSADRSDTTTIAPSESQVSRSHTSAEPETATLAEGSLRDHKYSPAKHQL